MFGTQFVFNLLRYFGYKDNFQDNSSLYLDFISPVLFFHKFGLVRFS